MANLHSYDDKDVSFYHIDKHARAATPRDSESLEALVSYLALKIPPNSRYPQVLLARGILIWIGVIFAKLSAHYRRTLRKGTCPREIKDDLAKRFHAGVFKTICCFAGIHCEIVEGREKDDISYNPGDADSPAIQCRKWNVLLADDRWHLVHPLWAVSCVLGFSGGGEILIQSDDVTNVEVLEHREGIHSFEFDDIWFCTNPKYFVTTCLPDPDQTQYQLIDNPISLEEFLGIPLMEQGFFKAKLRLLTENTCILLSKNGQCVISLLSEKNVAKYLDFSYKLSIKGDDATGLDIKDFQRFVMYSSNIETNEFSFDVRFPKVGSYFLHILVRNLETHGMDSCCKFKIECKEVNEHFGKLPLPSGKGGWGYGKTAKEAGLLKPSNLRPKIAVKPLESSSDELKMDAITFKLDQDASEGVDYEAVVCGSDSIDDNVNTVITRVDRVNNRLEIRPVVQQRGEYGLVVKTRAKDSGDRFEEVVKYLLTTHEDKDDIETRNKALKTHKRLVIQDEKRTKREEKKTMLLTEFEEICKEVRNLLQQ